MDLRVLTCVIQRPSVTAGCSGARREPPKKEVVQKKSRRLSRLNSRSAFARLGLRSLLSLSNSGCLNIHEGSTLSEARTPSLL